MLRQLGREGSREGALARARQAGEPENEPLGWGGPLDLEPRRWGGLSGNRGRGQRGRGGAVGVVLAKDECDFRAGEFLRKIAAVLQDLPHPAAGKLEPLLLFVGARARRRQVIANLAEEGCAELQRRDTQLVGLECIEGLLRFQRTVKAAYARVIAADDEVGDAVVLANQRVKESLAGTGVAHRRREGGE